MGHLTLIITLVWSCFSVAQPAYLITASGAIVDDWQKVGSAELDWLFFDVYRSDLLTPDGEYHLSHDVTPHPLALLITYERDISSAQLLEATDEQWRKLGFSAEDRKGWLEHLQRIFPDVQDGDELVYVSDGKLGEFRFKRVYQQEWVALGYIKQEAFSDAFLSIWLSPNSQYPQLRRQLIGMNRTEK
ncbi:chalcone isomerase family protein [Vibrio sp. FNV 38]|nr:chalcone isomerase family protein [Vibrio sp. FNV 38]